MRVQVSSRKDQESVPGQAPTSRKAESPLGANILSKLNRHRPQIATRQYNSKNGETSKETRQQRQTKHQQNQCGDKASGGAAQGDGETLSPIRSAAVDRSIWAEKIVNFEASPFPSQHQKLHFSRPVPVPRTRPCPAQLAQRSARRAIVALAAPLHGAVLGGQVFDGCLDGPCSAAMSVLDFQDMTV